MLCWLVENTIIVLCLSSYGSWYREIYIYTYLAISERALWRWSGFWLHVGCAVVVPTICTLSLILKVLFGIHQCFALLPSFSAWGKYGGYSSGFSRGILFVTLWLAEAALVINRQPGTFKLSCHTIYTVCLERITENEVKWIWRLKLETQDSWQWVKQTKVWSDLL